MERRRALLLLDNCEHVLAAAPELAPLLARCRQVCLLATSWAPLRLRWEHEFPVAPLALPDLGARVGRQEAVGAPAVKLFMLRAQAVQPRFRLTDENVEAVCTICRRLDGLPLAIELAAARSKVLAPQAIVDRLGDGLDVLAGGAGDLPMRQRTLRDAIAWSYDLLSEADQALFRRLAVFAGGAAAAAVTAVSGGWSERTVDAGLATLVDASLLTVDTSIAGSAAP